MTQEHSGRTDWPDTAAQQGCRNGRIIKRVQWCYFCKLIRIRCIGVQKRTKRRHNRIILRLESSTAEVDANRWVMRALQHSTKPLHTPDSTIGK
jgi:hypothetical protein